MVWGLRVEGVAAWVLGFWGFGVLGFWGFGVLGFWGFGVLGFWGFGVLGFWGLGVWGFGGLGVWGSTAFGLKLVCKIKQTLSLKPKIPKPFKARKPEGTASVYGL